MTLLQRLLDKVLYHPRGCWVFTGTRTPFGHGRLGDGYAHRASYEAFVGPIPTGMCVLHKCDNPGCVNPDHLFLGTKKDNSQDMVQKGRNVPSGVACEDHGMAKLTEDIVRECRRLHAAGGVTLQQLATRYGVTKQAIWFIVHNRTWVGV